MALFIFGETAMQVRPFDYEAAGAPEKKQEPAARGEDPARMRATPREADERRGEETPEEPGYGHGV
jgi:hypothetical protein